MLENLLLLLTCQLLGELAVRALALPVPGPVLGMALLVALLAARRGPSAGLERTSDGLLRHLGLLFVPAGVGLMTHGERLGSEGVALVVTVLVSTAAAVLAAAWTMTALMARRR